MKRRDFIRNTALAGTAGVVLPYILPSGRLFAASGNRIANHVVFVLFAGGVRNIESIEKSRGNLMPALLSGNEPITMPIGNGAVSLLPSVGAPALQTQGTLFKGFKYAQGPTGHFNGHTTAMTGVYTLQDLNIKQPPKFPTVFEYYRKHYSPEPSAKGAWWVSNSLGPYPSLNYSTYPGYGAVYGANYIQPTTIMQGAGYSALANPKMFDAESENKIAELRFHFDSVFKKGYAGNSLEVENPKSDYNEIQNFLKQEIQNAQAGQYNNFWGLTSQLINDDMRNVRFAEKILQTFQPELLVVNMQGVDICHVNYTQYCNNLHKADYAVGKLWQTIQNTPGLANDTIMIIAPEHGRNLAPNSVVDNFGFLALDHTSDATSREIFLMIVGPSDKVKQNQVISQNTGESIDIVPTINRILGYDQWVNSGVLQGRFLNEAFLV